MINNVMSIISVAIVSLLIIGFLIGVWRGWKKSLARFIALAVILVVSLLLSPVISSAIVDACTDGTVISVFGFSYDFQEAIGSLVGDSEATSQILSADGTTTQLAIALMNVAVNIVLFVVMFIVLSLLALFVHFIVCLVLRSKAKKEGELTPKKVGNRLIGGGIGFVSMIIICFTFLIPVFGVMNICNTFLDESQGENGTANATIASANASSLPSYLGANLYYTEDETIGQVESYIETYAEIKESYDSSPMGTVFNALGVSKLGELSFNYLTSVRSGDLDVNVTNEVVSIIRVYNAYKDTFVAEEFDIAKNTSIDGILKIYDIAENSKIVESYILELLPTLCENWSNGEAFLGIEPPIQGELSGMFNHALEIFVTDDMTRISNNLKAIMGVIKVANNNNLITEIRDNKVDVLDYLTNNTSFVKDAVLQLSSTPELRANLPILMNDVLKVAYDQMVGDEASFDDNALTNDEISAINWENEANTLQSLSNLLLQVYNNIQGDGVQANAITNELTNIGEVIDLSRQSALLSRPLQTFLVGFVDSENINLSDEIKTTITTNINSYWTNSDYKFKNMFSAIQETASVVESIAQNGELNLEGLKGAIELVVDSPEIKNTVIDLINSDVIGNLVPEGQEQTAEVLTSMLETFVTNTTSDTIEQDITAAEEIINIVTTVQNNSGNLVLGETDEEKQQSANAIVENLANSNAVMIVLETASEAASDTSAIKDVILSLGGDVSYVQSAIQENTNISAESRNILQSLFGV